MEGCSLKPGFLMDFGEERYFSASSLYKSSLGKKRDRGAVTAKEGVGQGPGDDEEPRQW